MARINLRVSEGMRGELIDLTKATGLSQTKLVKNALAERLSVQKAADAESSTRIPTWVPDGKYVALVRGSVAAVGDSVADVSATAIIKFPDEPIRVIRKGRRIKPIHYALLAEPTLKSWKYEIVEPDFFL
jgi:hypothetical protein